MIFSRHSSTVGAFARTLALASALAPALALLSPALLAPEVAAAAEEEEGVPLKVVVIDAEEKPIPTAVVRHPQEADRHRVNTFDGSWEAAVLYLPDGSELKFLKGMEITLEVSAPGYLNQTVVYIMRKRNNVIKVPLQKMTFETGGEDDDPVIQFGRDKPIDGQNTEPAP